MGDLASGLKTEDPAQRAPLLRRTISGGKAVDETRHRDGDHQEDQRRGHERREVEVRRLQDLRLPEGVDDAEDGDERRVLLQSDEVVEERRDHPTEGLWDHDVAECLHAREPEGARRALLRRVDRFDPGAIHLAHVRRIDQREGDERPEERILRHSRELQCRDPESQGVDHEDARHAAKEVDVRRRGEAERRECCAGRRTREGDHQAERQDEDLGDYEELHVHEECAKDLRKRLAEVAGAEESLSDDRPSGR